MFPVLTMFVSWPIAVTMFVIMSCCCHLIIFVIVSCHLITFVIMFCHLITFVTMSCYCHYICLHILLLSPSLSPCPVAVTKFVTVSCCRWMLLSQVCLRRCWFNRQRARTCLWTLTPRSWPWCGRQSACHALVWRCHMERNSCVRNRTTWRTPTTNSVWVPAISVVPKVFHSRKIIKEKMYLILSIWRLVRFVSVNSKT